MQPLAIEAVAVAMAELAGSPNLMQRSMQLAVQLDVQLPVQRAPYPPFCSAWAA